MATIVHIDFTPRLGAETTPAHKAAAATDATVSPLMAPSMGKLNPAIRSRIAEIISRASREGLTTAETAREIRRLGIDSKAANAIARTSLAVIADRARPF